MTIQKKKFLTKKKPHAHNAAPVDLGMKRVYMCVHVRCMPGADAICPWRDKRGQAAGSQHAWPRALQVAVSRVCRLAFRTHVLLHSGSGAWLASIRAMA